MAFSDVSPPLLPVSAISGGLYGWVCVVEAAPQWAYVLL